MKLQSCMKGHPRCKSGRSGWQKVDRSFSAKARRFFKGLFDIFR